MWLFLAITPWCNAQRQLHIDEMFNMLEAHNSSLRAGRTGLEASSQAIAVARSQRLPELNAQLSASYNGNVLQLDRNFSNAQSFSQPHWGNSLVVEAQQVVYAGGAINAGIRLAELGKQMEEHNLNATRNDVRFTTLAQYLELIKLDNAIKVYEENILLTERLIDHIKARQGQGMALKNDITRYELQLQDLLLGKRKVEDSRKVANHQLCNALGMADETIVPDTTIASAHYGIEGEAHWQELGAASSPVLARTDVSTQMAAQQVRLAKSELLPKIALVAADNFSGPFSYDIPPINKNFNVWYIGLGVKYSIGNLWKSNKKVRQAKTTLQQKQEAHAVTGETLDNRMQEAYTLYLQSYTELETQRKNVELASQNYTVIRNRYENQLVLITDMLDASNMKLSAELREVDARVNIAFAYYRLKYIAGTL